MIVTCWALRAAERDWPAALTLLDDAERVYVGDFSPPVHPIHATRARVLAAAGDVDAALSWARDHGVAVGDELTYLNEYDHVTLARVLLAHHRGTGSEASLRDAGLLHPLDAVDTPPVPPLRVTAAIAATLRDLIALRQAGSR